MANETVATPKSTTLEKGRWVYRRGFVLGKNGLLPGPYDQMATLIPQLNALTCVIADEEFAWNGEVRQQLMYLVSRMADELNELLEEDSTVMMNERMG